MSNLWCAGVFVIRSWIAARYYPHTLDQMCFNSGNELYQTQTKQTE